MLYAHAATRLLADGGDLKDGAAVAQAVRQTSFVGIGGSVVALDENGDRVQDYEVMNYVWGGPGRYGASTYRAKPEGYELQEHPGGYKYDSTPYV